MLMSRQGVVLVSGFVGLSVLGFASGCGDDNPLGALCCDGFEVGAQIDPGAIDADVEFVAFAQAVADFAGTATAMITNVGNACKAIAVDLGRDENAVKPGEPAATAEAWCAEAVAAIKAEVTGMGSISVSFQEPKCSVNASVQANCEANCSANVECEVTPAQIEARCEGGELSVKCEGQCQGSCEGSANLAVACEGICNGTCEGNCDGACSTMAGNQCKGSCDGTCTGECRGTCEIEANANVECNGECSGECMGTASAPKCKGELSPPSAECQGSANCQASCDASASAKAECTPPSVEIEASGNIDAKVIGSLKLNLPNLLMVAKAQAALSLENAQAMVDIGLSIDPASLSVTAAACLVPIGGTIGVAVENIEASVSATASVFAEIGIN